MSSNYIDDLAGRIKERVPVGALPGEDSTDLFRIYAVLLIAKGENVTLKDVHDAWSAWMSGKDGSHQALVPYADLSVEAKSYDQPFLDAILATWAADLGPYAEFQSVLFPNGVPEDERGIDRMLDLYKIMVTSSETLVGRRQVANTFFLTANGAVLTAAGLFLTKSSGARSIAGAILALTVVGFVISAAWRRTIKSYGQLNGGKFAVINAIERKLPAAIFDAEWIHLGAGKDKKKYVTFTSSETWSPGVFIAAYLVAGGIAAAILFGCWTP